MTSGIYILIIKLDTGGRFPIGKLGILDFPSGFYCYAGSALNGVEARIARHFRQEKKLHWHIDYLLQHAEVFGAVYAEIPGVKNSSRKSLRDECRVAQHLAGFFPGIRGFGCSDCRCSSHLFYGANAAIISEKTAEAFNSANLPVQVISPT